MVDEVPKVKRYYSDAFDVYERLWYHGGTYEVSQGKAATYSVEADNVELRHYLALVWGDARAVFLAARKR